jgi:hypothetical protein
MLTIPGPLKYTDLVPYDQHHYHGTKAVDDMVAKVGCYGRSRVRTLAALLLTVLIGH